MCCTWGITSWYDDNFCYSYIFQIYMRMQLCQKCHNTYVHTLVQSLLYPRYIIIYISTEWYVLFRLCGLPSYGLIYSWNLLPHLSIPLAVFSRNATARKHYFIQKDWPMFKHKLYPWLTQTGAHFLLENPIMKTREPWCARNKFLRRGVEGKFGKWVQALVNCRWS